MTKQTTAADRPATTSLDLAAVRPLRWPLLITAIILASELMGRTPLAYSHTGMVPAGARLEVGWSYLVLAPLFDVLDTLSVLTLSQHLSVLLTFVGAYTAWRAFPARAPVGWVRRSGIELGSATIAFALLFGLYAFGILGPRPMVMLVVDDPDVVVVDFHGHTHHSHDARTGFDAERRREWHRASGFHAVYVSDHRTWDGYLEGEPGNPRRAGDDVSLLPAIEIKWAGEYANALGDADRYRHAAEGNYLNPDSLYASLLDGGPSPTLVLTLPARLDAVPRHTADSIGYLAIEVSDASPRGLQQSHRDRATILALADSLDMALVAASNNHGWGRTAAAWTLLRIPDWRDMTPIELSQAIEGILHSERRQATRVVERRGPRAITSPAGVAMAVPTIGWEMFRGLNVDRRIAWLAYAWGIALLVLALRGRLGAEPAA